MLAGPISLAAARLISVLLVLLAATTVYNSFVAPTPGNRVRPTAAALLSGTVSACTYGSQPYYFVDSEGAQFNETPTSWQIRAYDPRCQPRALADTLVSADRSNSSRTVSDVGGDGCSVDSDRQLTVIIYGDRYARPTPAARSQRRVPVQLGAPVHKRGQLNVFHSLHRPSERKNDPNGIPGIRCPPCQL